MAYLNVPHRKSTQNIRIDFLLNLVSSQIYAYLTKITENWKILFGNLQKSRFCLKKIRKKIFFKSKIYIFLNHMKFHFFTQMKYFPKNLISFFESRINVFIKKQKLTYKSKCNLIKISKVRKTKVKYSKIKNANTFRYLLSLARHKAKWC